MKSSQILEFAKSAIAESTQGPYNCTTKTTIVVTWEFAKL